MSGAESEIAASEPPPDMSIFMDRPPRPKSRPPFPHEFVMADIGRKIAQEKKERPK